MYEYFQECIKNKTLPKDTPGYIKEALERAIKEYEKGIILEKSTLTNFAEKYVIKGKPGILPKDFFEEKRELIVKFFKNYRETKIRMVMICKMEKEEKLVGNISSIKQAIFYFQSKTFINIETTNEYDIIDHIEEDILEKLVFYKKKIQVGISKK